MNKNIQIRKMLDYLSKRFVTPIEQPATGVFLGLAPFIKITHPEYISRDHQAVMIDFNNELVEWSAWDESGHNGSEYNSINGVASWELVEKSFDDIRALTLRHMALEVLEDEEKRKKQLKLLAAQAKLDQLLAT